MSPPPRSIKVSVDRGGTFTDVYANIDNEKELVIKLLSVDPKNYKDAPTEGIRRVLEIATGEKIPRGGVLDTSLIDYIRLSTTVATNALLERKGARHAFLVTKGFKDLLRISNQSRPSIFALNVQRPPVLYESVIEVDERVTLVGYTYDTDQAGSLARYFEDQATRKLRADAPEDIRVGVSGELVQILKTPDLAAVRADLERVYASGVRTLAICFVHSYTFPDHELAVEKLARDVGFEHISVSSQLSPQIKMVPRATSSTADAYLTPVLRDYLSSFLSGFDRTLAETRDGRARVEFMTSEGTLVPLHHFSGLKSILSGPAGGVVGYSLTAYDPQFPHPVIGFDMGGTSTDVSRFADGVHEVVYETTTAGIAIQSPQMDINTVAAGGGSCLSFRNGLFNVGPESASAHPGPACYRKGGPLATTDANLVLGRLLPAYFPHIFGPHEDEPLDVSASLAAFEKLRTEINTYMRAQHDAAGTEWTDLSVDDVALGFVNVANETMARPIRSLTEARGFSLSKHVLSSFGGAGGQHAVELARKLGITRILVHRFSSILSAYGMSLADRSFEAQEPSSETFSAETAPYIEARLAKLREKVIAELTVQGFDADHIVTEDLLNMRYDGADTTLMTRLQGAPDFARAFEAAYKNEYGFLLENKAIIVDDIRVRGVGKTHDSLGDSTWAELDKLTFAPAAPAKQEAQKASLYFGGKYGRIDVPVYLLSKLDNGDIVAGPAVIVDGTQTIILDPKSTAQVTSKQLYITLEEL